jgi:hypothetical protein
MPTDQEDARQQILQQVRKRRIRSAASRESGRATAEYAIGTLAAAGFAAILVKVVTSDQIRTMLVNIIKTALNLAG